MSTRFEIKSDHQHQLFYRRLLDTLEEMIKMRREEYLNTPYDEAVWKSVAYKRARDNYMLVRKRYERERIARGWGH